MSEQLQEGLGLYVRFAKNNKIKKRLVAKSGELKMKDSTIESELIDFFNVRMDYYDQVVIHMIKLTEITRPDAPDYDFEKAKMAFERLLEFTDDLIKIYEEELLELVQDLYSTKKELKPDVKRCKFQSLIGNNITKCRLNHKVRIKKEEPRILQICNGSGRVRVDQIEKIEKGILVEGTLEVSVLYVSAEDELPFFAKQIQIPFVQKIDIHEMKENTDYKVETGNIQINTTMIDSEEMEIKAVVDLAVKAVEHIWQNVITQVSEEPLDLQRLEGLAGIVVYVVKENDSLWSIGKNYCMSVSDIRELNGLESDVIQKNDRLILCKSPGNITK